MILHDFNNYSIDIYKGNKLIGSTYSLLTFYDFLVQVKEEQSSDYSFMFKGVIYPINKNSIFKIPEDNDFPLNIFLDLHIKLM